MITGETCESNLLIEKCRWVQFCAMKLPLCWEAINFISWHIQPVPRQCVKADGVYNQRISMMLMLRWHVWVWSRTQRWICADCIKYRVSFCHCLLLQVWYTAKCWSWLSTFSEPWECRTIIDRLYRGWKQMSELLLVIFLDEMCIQSYSPANLLSSASLITMS